ncbi:MAG: ABC transporter permease [Thermoflexales bacterium]|nr:ABC transporter permease [Thermoflexales bacterium]
MKILAITLKELTIVVRDWVALVVMLVAPLALALVMNFAFSGIMQGSGLSPIPVRIVNQDEGEIGQAIVDAFHSDELRELLVPTDLVEVAEARQEVDAGRVAAAVLIPPGLTRRVFYHLGDPAQVEVYVDPAQSFSASVVHGIVERMAQIVLAGAAGGRVTTLQLLNSGRAEAAEEENGVLSQQMGRVAAQEAMTVEVVTLKTVVGSRQEADEGFDFLAYYVPGMAILFLMFTMMSSARTLLSEREMGTWARLRAAPLSAAQLLGGKVLGTLATGLLQMTVLVIVTRYLLGVRWGAPLAVGVVVVLTVSAVAALGLFVATIARSTSQASLIGSTLVMILAAAGGNFVPRIAFPEWLKLLSLVGPNAWAMVAFQKLDGGAGLGGLGAEIAALAAMTAVFFGLALWGLGTRKD